MASTKTNITISMLKVISDLLDTLNEWYHNPTTGELWVMTNGINPSGMDIRGKVSTYAFEIKKF